jgi:hypothetical protein
MAYAHNDPVHNTDRSGRFSMGEISMGQQIFGAFLAYQAVEFGLNNVAPGQRPRHYYETNQIRICGRCTPQQVYQAMLSMPAPAHIDPTVDAPVASGQEGYAGWGIFPGGPVVFTRLDGALTLVNQTLPLHILHNGRITRTAMHGMGGVTIKTVGEGDNHTALIALLNKIVGKVAFESLDESIRNAFQWMEQ